MTRQEPVGATIAAADGLTYAQQPAAFFQIDRPAGVPAPRKASGGVLDARSCPGDLD
jgi:hypothetical protein